MTMRTFIKMGWQAQEGGGFKAVIQWQINDGAEHRRFSREIYATEVDAMGQAEYMAKLLVRIAEAQGYEVFDVSTN
jgi:hypothetical protein